MPEYMETRPSYHATTWDDVVRDDKQPISQAGHQVIVNVGEEELRVGVRYDSRYCPVALALKKALPDYHIEVGVTTALIGIPYRSINDQDTTILQHYVQLQVEAVEAINRFDSGLVVTPFSFVIYLL